MSAEFIQRADRHQIHTSFLYFSLPPSLSLYLVCVDIEQLVSVPIKYAYSCLGYKSGSSLKRNVMETAKKHSWSDGYHSTVSFTCSWPWLPRECPRFPLPFHPQTDGYRFTDKACIQKSNSESLLRLPALHLNSFSCQTVGDINKHAQKGALCQLTISR